MQNQLASPSNVQDYLVEHGLCPPGVTIEIHEMGGGVSNTVLWIEWDAPGGEEKRWVMKQSLAKLRVQDDWYVDRWRIFREAEAIQALGPVLGPSAVPQLVHIDRENYLFIMTAAPPGSVTWKDLLLDGKVGMTVARQAGTLLALMITSSQQDPLFKTLFEDRTVFVQARIDPYYRTAAARHPDVRHAVANLIEDSLQIRTALVHGDYSPKNLLVRGSNVFLIDFEVIHWGDPAFDSGFLLNHLFLKAFHQPQFCQLYFTAIKEFWKELLRGIEKAGLSDFEYMTLRHLGALMLARIDGKSPVEYITDELIKERVRCFAKHLLLAAPRDLEETLEIARQTLGGSQAVERRVGGGGN